MSTPFWDAEPELWDRVLFGASIYTPGLATVFVHKKGEMDANKAPGSNGAAQTWLGFEPAQVHIKLRLWTQKHLDGYAELVDIFQPAPGDAPMPVDVYYPSLALHRVRSLYLVHFEPPAPGAVKGVWEALIIGDEHNPADKGNRTFTPIGSTDPANVPQVPIGIIKDNGTPSQTGTAP